MTRRPRDGDIGVWLETLGADVRYAGRALRSSPAFATVTILSLALGIGANTAIFSLINAVMLQALPVTRPNELVVVTRDERTLTHAMWEALRERQTVFAGMFAYASTIADLRRGGEAHRVPVGFVTGEFFSTLGVRAAFGRVMAAPDDGSACAPVAVASHRFWQSELGGERDAVGRTITLDGHAFQVIGVTDPSFFGIEIGYHVPVWIPLCAEATFVGADEAGLHSRMGRIVIGRLNPGATLAQARAQLATMRPAILDATVQYSAPKNGILLSPAEYRNTIFGMKAFTNGDPALRNTYGAALLALMAVVGVVLLIACANVANLLLARATVRQREIAVRMALGASRARLTRQLLTESILLSALGAAGGALFAAWGSRLLVAMLSTSPQSISIDLTPDWRVVVFTASVAVGTGLLFGLAPAWRAGRAQPHTVFKAQGRGVVEGHSRFRLGKALVIGQVALSLVSVTGAGLLLASWRELATLDPGYDRDHVLLVSADAGATAVSAPTRGAQYQQIIARLRAVPGVAAAGAAAYTPLVSSWNTVITVDGGATAAKQTIVGMNEVSDGYFAAIGTPLRAGRDFSSRDTPSATRVGIVNERLAREYLGGSRALGARVRFGSPPNEPVEIVGIVADSRQLSLREASQPMVYLPFSQDTAPEASVRFAIRTTGRPTDVATAVKAAFREIDPRISFSLTTLARRLANEVRLPRTLGLLSAYFGGLAILLAAIGLYGIMAYTVARRRNEIGIRLALGATQKGIVRFVLRDVGRVVLVGLGIGLLVSLSVTRLATSMLYSVTPHDPKTFLAATTLLGVVGLVAGALPARRASRLDPASALRED